MKWEYMAIEEKLDAARLAELGVEGRELVAVVSPGHFVLHYFFKRTLNA